MVVLGLAPEAEHAERRVLGHELDDGPATLVREVVAPNVEAQNLRVVLDELADRSRAGVADEIAVKVQGFVGEPAENFGQHHCRVDAEQLCAELANGALNAREHELLPVRSFFGLGHHACVLRTRAVQVQKPVGLLHN
eukprot:Amastigsp_a4999_12.p5 type:complete len:138 gc:universal Amastigsp_a4999_12:1672-2085(+)